MVTGVDTDLLCQTDRQTPANIINDDCGAAVDLATAPLLPMTEHFHLCCLALYTIQPVILCLLHGLPL